MTMMTGNGFYFELDEETLIHEPDPAITFSFIQLIGGHLERHRLVVLWREIYLAHYDPTILAVCLIYDHRLWLKKGFKRIIGVDRCTSNYISGTDEYVDVYSLPELIRLIV